MTPKYEIGAIVWNIHVERSSATHPCPDCNGTRTWTATSRVGETFEINCLRCAQSYANLPANVPSLSYSTATVSVRALTVGSIRFDSEETRGPWSYMCIETGVGSGYVYYESDLFSSEADAHATGEEKRRALQVEIDSQPPNQISAAVCPFPLSAALPYAWKADLWHAWERYRSLRDVIEELIGDTGRCEYEMGEAACDRLREERESRPWRTPHPVERVIEAAYAVLEANAEGTYPTLAQALAATVPPWLRPAPVEEVSTAVQS